MLVEARAREDVALGLGAAVVVGGEASATVSRGDTAGADGVEVRGSEGDEPVGGCAKDDEVRINQELYRSKMKRTESTRDNVSQVELRDLVSGNLDVFVTGLGGDEREHV
jgi:hypothetical protein